MVEDELEVARLGADISMFESLVRALCTGTGMAAAAALLFGGCLSTSDVVPIGKNSYSVTVDSHGPGLSTTRTEALKRANSFCAQQKKVMIVESFDNKLGINTYSSSRVFRCGSEDDPDYQKPNLRTDASGG